MGADMSACTNPFAGDEEEEAQQTQLTDNNEAAASSTKSSRVVAGATVAGRLHRYDPELRALAEEQDRQNATSEGNRYITNTDL
jgi:hypothetical protein